MIQVLFVSTFPRGDLTIEKTAMFSNETLWSQYLDNSRVCGKVK